MTVSWQNIPPGEGEYDIELSNVSTEYSLNPDKAYSLTIKDGVKHDFPAFTKLTGTHCNRVGLFDLSLETEFRTFRYFRDRMPAITVLYKGKAITNTLDLGRAFKEWGYDVENRPEQIYNIRITILKDGSAVLSQWFDGSVEDWEDGGIVHISK